MAQKYDPEIKLNQFGHPDIDFYIREAKQLRRDAISALIRDIAGWLKKTIGRGQHLPMRAVH